MAWPTVTTSAATPLVDQSSGNVNWSHSVGVDQTKICVLVPSGNPGATDRVTGVTYNGIALSNVANVGDGNWERVQIWHLHGPATGSNSVNVAFSGGTADIDIGGHAISFDGAASAIGTASTNTGTTANPSVTVADSASGDTVISVLATDEGSNAALTADGTLIAEDEDVSAGDSDFSSQRQTASGANTVCSWTQSSTGQAWAAAGVAIKQAGGPTITQQPVAVVAKPAQAVAFTVAASGAGTLTYQWQENSSGAWVNISGATSSTLNTTAPGNGGRAYAVRCAVTDDNGTNNSEPASLIVPTQARFAAWSGMGPPQ